MDRPQKYFAIGASFLLSCLVVPNVLDYFQHKKQIQNARVVSLVQYHFDNDLHISSGGYRLMIQGEEKAINFSLRNWDKTVQEGDSIDLIVRPSFFLGGLEGLKIDDHK